MKPKAKERKPRSTHLELLGGVPSGLLHQIRDVAQAADLPPERVFRDILAIGVSVVSDPEESPYQSLIAFRNGLAQKQAELSNVHLTSNLESETPAVIAEGSQFPERGAILQIDPERLTVPQEGTTQERFDDAFKRSGQLSEDQADSGLPSLREGT